MLNKPRGYVTTMSDEKGRKTVAQLTADVGVRVYPVGRLDMESEGLLIMTALMHPGSFFSLSDAVFDNSTGLRTTRGSRPGALVFTANSAT